MELKFNSSEYKKVRENYSQYWTTLPYWTSQHECFDDELKKHDASIIGIETYPTMEVTDSLGMNEYRVIDFKNDDLYTLFLLKWL
jgi:hypothetical protein